MRPMLTRLLIVALFSTTSCHPPRGKDELKASPQERAQILKACANGLHDSAQECSNAKAVENADKLERSL